MLYLACVGLAVLAFYFWLQQKYARELICDIIESVESGNNLILERPKLLNPDIPLNKCQRVLDDNILKISRLQNERKQRTHAFNEILGGMLDGAFILDANHRITFANSSSSKNFAREGKVEGRRVEAVIDSFEVLELLDQLSRGEKPGHVEFAFRKNGTLKYFEVAGATLSAIRISEKEVYLLLFRDVTKIKHAEIMRKDFVANASHELRTPITMIKGFAETLTEDNELNTEYARRFLEKIFKNSVRLQSLVDDLLSLSELEGSEEPVNLTNNKLSDVIEGMDQYLRDKPYVDVAKLSFSLAEEKESFPFDAIKVAVAIGNLVDNAFKYAGNFSKVTISTTYSDDGSSITCAVSDDGNGIPPDDLARIFERFYVVDKGRSREKGGTGLGLSIVKHIAEAHGGQVWVESKVGLGTTFSFSLPVFSKVPAAPELIVT